MKKTKKLLKKWMDGVKSKNRDIILSMLDVNPAAVLLDLGCDDGVWSRQIGNKIGTDNIYGVEVVKSRVVEAEKNGLKVSSFNLNERFDYEDSFFDVVHSNQVIEHLYDTDNFISEIYRVLKPGGYAVISTVNLASWHNIFSLILGFQPFDASNISVKGNIGNPASIWYKVDSDSTRNKSWQHVRVLTLHTLKEFLKVYEFTDIKSKSVGYYPLPNFVASLDKNHGHYITVKAYKK
jgi:ubiquinone/menaquinone biosynthesis C-methylase UbiE